MKGQAQIHTFVAVIDVNVVSQALDLIKVVNQLQHEQPLVWQRRMATKA